MEYSYHPYGKRRWWRERLPWFLINVGIASKGKNCELVKAEHHWHNSDGKNSACYFCEVEKEGQLWNKTKQHLTTHKK